MRRGKASGPDKIPAEAIKADIETSTEILQDLFGKIWEQEDIPTEWKEGYLVRSEARMSSVTNLTPARHRLDHEKDYNK